MVAPGAAVPAPRRWDFIFDDNPKYTDPRWVYLVGGTDEYRNGQVLVEVPVDGARERLRSAGWRVAGSVAYRDGWRVEIQESGLAVTRRTPGAVLPLTTVGLLLGGLAGWLCVAWAYRRGRRNRPAWRAVAIVLTGAGLFALFPATTWSAIALVQSYREPHDPVPGWIGYVVLLFRPLAYLSGLALLGAVAAVAAPRSHHRRTATRRI
jgi:MFS family permease